MILYTDTSALVKKYIFEAGSDEVIMFFDQNPTIGTTTITRIEMAAAISKSMRYKWVGENDANVAWNVFQSHWPSYNRLPVSETIIEHAISLVWRHSLRTNDSLQLSRALAWQEMVGEEVVFVCFNQQLLEAAKLEGLHIWSG